ncbi:hypothetical protein Barb6_03343 [Bacteroidales bacterium Barb6]|nr:hypothetical protein Barb6_03343 [Bacteroidales bacterium Barb6]
MLVAGSKLFEFLFLLADVLPLAFPVAFVADDVLQVFVHVNVVAAHFGGGVGYHVLRQPDFAGYLDGKGAAGVTGGKFEKGLHEVAVVEHGTVYNALGFFGKVLEVLIVRGDDAEAALAVEAVKQGFGDGSANLRLRPAAELIDEEESRGVAVFYEKLHVRQVGTVRTQVVLNALLVAYVNKYI